MVGRIPPGYRAVSVKIEEVSGVAYQVQPGDWVDVIVVMDVDTGGGAKKETMAEVILQHVQVAAIGQGTGSEPEPAKGAHEMKPAKSATLLVPEEEVPKLHLAGTRGKITLAMRGEDDKTPMSAARAYGSELMNATRTAPVELAPSPAPAIKKPAPLPEQDPYAVMVFRGSTSNETTMVERITFENAHSSKIVEVAHGAPTRESATMSGAKDRGRVRASKPTGATKEPADAGESDVVEEGKPDAGE